MKRLNKKGAEFTIATLVVIVLAIIVLVVLALGFGTGWTNLWSKISDYFSPVNVDAVSQACSYACTTKENFNYCCRVREVKFEKGQDPIAMTCENSAIKPENCDLTCDVVTDCEQVLCAGEFKDECENNEKENEQGKIKSDGTVIQKGEKCCESSQ